MTLPDDTPVYPAHGAGSACGKIESGTIDDARHVQLAQLIDRLKELDPTLPTVVYCAGGYRSSIAASTLRAHGFTDVSDLLGGYPAWTNLHPTANEQDSQP